jgi:hypothetical protein
LYFSATGRSNYLPEGDWLTKDATDRCDSPYLIIHAIHTQNEDKLCNQQAKDQVPVDGDAVTPQLSVDKTVENYQFFEN